MKSGNEYPKGEAEFDAPIEKISIGGGFVGIVDSNHRVFMWGDNFSGQLG